MRETSNYKLTQWDKTDRIEMEDFNSDNQKIDSQLHAAMQHLAQAASQEGLAAEQAAREAADAAQLSTLRSENRLVRLGEWTSQADTGVLSFPLPEQWYSNYWKLYLIGELKTSTATTFGFSVNEEESYRFPVASGVTRDGRVQIELTPFSLSRTTHVKTSCLIYEGPDENPSNAGLTRCVADLTPAEILSVGLRLPSGSYYFKAGSHFVLYGLR